MNILSKIGKIPSFTIMLIGGISFGSGAIAGNITDVTSSSANSIWGSAHSNIFQLRVVSGTINADGCSTEFGAIGKDESHLIDLALMAVDKDWDVDIHVDPNRKYVSDRCMITDILIHNL
jgi:hypothetical protein